MVVFLGMPEQDADLQSYRINEIMPNPLVSYFAAVTKRGIADECCNSEFGCTRNDLMQYCYIE